MKKKRNPLSHKVWNHTQPIIKFLKRKKLNILEWRENSFLEIEKIFSILLNLISPKTLLSPIEVKWKVLITQILWRERETIMKIDLFVDKNATRSGMPLKKKTVKITMIFMAFSMGMGDHYALSSSKIIFINFFHLTKIYCRIPKKHWKNALRSYSKISFHSVKREAILKPVDHVRL